MDENIEKPEERQNALAERHKKILDLLKQNGTISVSALTESLNVSEVTVRKDLSMLEQRKKLHRIHGGAILVSPFIGDRHVNEKEKQNVDEKNAIGIAASALITENDSILIASGTTVLFFANEIVPKGHLTVVTASIGVTSVLSQRKDVDVIQLGGIVRFSSLSVVGPAAEQMLGSFNCSKLFMGVDGIDLDFGLTTTNALEASLNKVMIECSQKLVVLADSSKFGRKGFSRICGLDSVDEIITDGDISARTVQELEARGVKVTVVRA